MTIFFPYLGCLPIYYTQIVSDQRAYDEKENKNKNLTKDEVCYTICMCVCVLDLKSKSHILQFHFYNNDYELKHTSLSFSQCAHAVQLKMIRSDRLKVSIFKSFSTSIQK